MQFVVGCLHINISILQKNCIVIQEKGKKSMTNLLVDICIEVKTPKE